MANQEQLDILKRGVETWNEWRKKNQDIQPDFFRVDLSEAKLNKINLGGANLSGANLNETDLSRADLRANLSGADLSRANLNGANLSGANLNEAYLSRADLSGADLGGANLSGANLNEANLRGTDLSRANLSKATLSGANLSGGADLSRANLNGANLSGANLSGAYLRETDLSRADLRETDLSEAYLSGANLSGANLNGANLSGANLSGANLRETDLSEAYLSEADLSGASLSDSEKERLRGKGVIGLEGAEMLSGVDQNETLEVLPDDTALSPSIRSKPLSVALAHPSIVRIRITEEPLTPQNLAMILTALAELTTKFWLIAKRRFAQLIEYTQTHDVRFADEAGTIITRVTYNSPFSFDWKIDISATGAADAFVTTLDGIKQREERLKKLELENQERAQKIREAELKLEQQQQMAALEIEKQKLEIEKERQSLIEQRLDAQKKQIVDALEIASKAIDRVYPKADTEMRPTLIQTVMNNILQLQSIKGLELAPPKPKDQEEK